VRDGHGAPGALVRPRDRAAPLPQGGNTTRKRPHAATATRRCARLYDEIGRAPTGVPSRAPTLAPTPANYGAPALPHVEAPNTFLSGCYVWWRVRDAAAPQTSACGVCSVSAVGARRRRFPHVRHHRGGRLGALLGVQLQRPDHRARRQRWSRPRGRQGTPVRTPRGYSIGVTP
jgi:hypothetical protein